MTPSFLSFCHIVNDLDPRINFTVNLNSSLPIAEAKEEILFCDAAVVDNQKQKLIIGFTQKG